MTHNTSHKLLILGNGYIGTRLQQDLNCAISGRILHTFADVERELARFKPAVVINCIGHTGFRSIDDCEQDKDNAFFINVIIPRYLAEIALRRRIKLVHLSSGCIYYPSADMFRKPSAQSLRACEPAKLARVRSNHKRITPADGAVARLRQWPYGVHNPLSESTPPDFFTQFYAYTKIYAERVLLGMPKAANILITRIRLPLDNKPHPRNLLDKLITYQKTIDVANSITYIPDFIAALKHLIGIDARGLYNTTNAGGLRYPELLDVYKKYVPDFSYEVIDYRALKAPRAHLVLSVEKLKRVGFPMRDIHAVLDECVREYLAVSRDEH